MRPDGRRRCGPTGHAPPQQPIDPQDYVLPEDQTEAEYQAVPGTDWGNQALTPSVKKWRAALVVVDFPNQNFVVSESAPHATIFGTRRRRPSDSPRRRARVLRGLPEQPVVLNNGLTMNKYWMENSLGRYGVELVPFGPYRMPGNAFEYHLRDAGNAPGACPSGFEPCNRNIRNDALAAWRAEQGPTINTQFDNIFYMVAGQDESGTWQEFGEMMFQTMDDVTEPFGNPAAEAELGPDALRAVDVVRLGDEHLAERGRQCVDGGRELRHGRLRP